MQKWEARTIKKDTYGFLSSPDLSKEKKGPAGAMLHGITGHKFTRILFCFFLLKSKSSGISTSRSSLFYTRSMYELAILQHAHSSWSVYVLYLLDADGALGTMLPVFRENLDCYYSGTTYSCLWVRIYFWINFSHQTIWVSSANSLTQLIR